jgi:hypothetical protein
MDIFKPQKSTTVTPSLQDCNPEKNLLLKKHGIRGIIVAASVTAVVVLIILISKWNDVRQQRVPSIWKGRLRSIVKDCSGAVKLAKESERNPEIAIQHTIQAKAMLDDAKKIAGTTDLAKISGFDMHALEAEIDMLSVRYLSLPASFSEEVPENTKERKESVRDTARRLYESQRTKTPKYIKTIKSKR